MYKKAWYTCKVVVLHCRAIAYLTFSSPPHLKLPNIYDTLWSVKNRIFSEQIELLLLLHPKRFFDSSVVPSFLVRKVENKSFPGTHKLGERTGQVWRDNRRGVRTHEKNSGDSWPIGHNNTKHFLCPIRSQHSLEFLKIVWWESLPRGSFARNFRPAFSPDPTDSPWVSEHAIRVKQLSMAATLRVIWLCACVRYWPFLNKPNSARV